MDAFLAKHADAIRGVLSCFDRVLFRGSLPLMSGDAMADFLKRKQVKRRTLKTFLLTPADRVKKPALSMAAAAKRPHQYLSGPARKEDLARQIADRDGSEEGLVCVFSVPEPCRTFALVWKEAHPFVRPAPRQCLQLYFYFLDRHLGLIHVKVQTWFPFPIQVYVHGHDWLARRFDRRGGAYSKPDTVFVPLDASARAQKLADGFASVTWPRLLGRYAHKVNPLLGDLLAEMEYYWVTTQAEYSTDVLLGSHQALAELLPRLFTYSTLYFEARDVLSFLGRKVHGSFQGEVVTDQVDFAQMPKRLPGRRVKHRRKRNWLKLYNKAGAVLRVETVINDPTEVRIRRRVRRHGRTVMAWGPLRQGVAFRSRYQRICGQSNARYLEALAQVDDPTPALRALDALSTRAPTPNGRSERAFTPVARDDRTLFEVLMSGEHILRGFTNRAVRQALARAAFPLAPDPAKHSGQVTRLFRRLHAHQLIAKIPRSRRWRVSFHGRRVMATAIKLREVAYPGFYAQAA